VVCVQGWREEWMIVFFICSGFYVFSTVVYALFASGVEQPWAKSGVNQLTDISIEVFPDITKTAENDNMTTHF